MASQREIEYLYARDIVAPLLSAAFRRSFFDQRPELVSIERALEQTFSIVDTPQGVCALSMDNFCSLIQDMFSKLYLDNYVERARSFDLVSGFETSVAAAIITTQPVAAVVTVMRQAFAGAARNAAIAHVEALAKTEAKKAPARAVPKRKPGPSHKCTVNDIHLSGPTIVAAWRNNRTTRCMEDDACYPVLRNPGWEPSTETRLPVYHGTSKPNSDGEHIALKLSHFRSDVARNLLCGSIMHGQIAPDAPQTPMVRTAYSPFRCFLWSLFAADVLGSVPSADGGGRRTRDWHCHCRRPHVHKGVRLLSFMPAPNSPATVARPSSNVVGVRIPTLDNWPRGTPWPERIHYQETSVKSGVTSAFTKQHWQTAWSGRGIETINASRDKVMSISLKITAAGVDGIDHGYVKRPDEHCTVM